ncbi:centrosomal protein of 170 kDa protein B isoform X2 [Boleophthalmus pectinirostris]|uniref:centrosomal protein of 170 kDa protein B isoform X2 n=1 Tax=Boleophthalmus pectinirostris TaxID=150288 RepID=UPI00243192B5|nr:centrosomal protein of 170 kDa protein B isoform X2 [Boleophthalmus pectinirostris]
MDCKGVGQVYAAGYDACFTTQGLDFTNAEKVLTRGPKMSVTSWFLVSSSGTRHRLPREMIFVGRDDCELMLQSRSVDKQHAVINYDPKTDEHMVKDLGSLNGTFVNDLRIPDQTYITLKLSDVIRFGYDVHVYILEKSQHKVPEEALKHEKYTSQLQLGIKALEAKTKEKLLHSPDKSKDFVSKGKLQDRTERKAHSCTAATDTPISKPTPLYGQPSWWGEDEDPEKKKSPRGGKQPEQDSPDSTKDSPRYELNGSLSDSQAKSIFSYRREPSYFEIPTKELHQRPAKKPESPVHEVPTKDIPDQPKSVLSTPTPPVVQSHASFTIEFDDCTPGKMKIKDHITKFSYRQQKKLPHTQTAAAPTEVMSAESKVADWLVQSNVSMMRRRSQAEDLYSTISDPSMQKRLSNWDDSTHSDSGIPGTNGNDFLPSDLQSKSHVSRRQSHSPPERYTSSESKEPTSLEPHSFHGHTKTETKQAFVIEIFEDSQRKKRSQSFTSNTPAPVPGLRPEVERSRKSPSPTEERTPPTQRYTVPLKDCDSPGPQRAGSLRREKTEERISTGFSSRSTSSVSTRPFSSVGRKSKLARDFTAEFLKQTKQNASVERKSTSPPNVKANLPVQDPDSPPPSITANRPQTSSPIHHPVPLNSTMTSVTQEGAEIKTAQSSRNDEEDNLSDAGTYTIEADVQDKELEEARSKIDQIQAPKWMSCWASLADSYTECPPPSSILDSYQMEQSGVGSRHKVTLSQSQVSPEILDHSDSRTYQVSINKGDAEAPSIHVQYDMQSTFDMEKSTAPRSQDSLLRLSVQDDVEPDSLSDASNSGDGSIIEQRRKPLQDAQERKLDNRTLQSKSTSFYIGSEENVTQPENTTKAEKKHSGKTFSTATLTKQRAVQEPGKVRPSISAPLFGNTAVGELSEGSGVTLLRQESFTTDRPSTALLPHISSPESAHGSASQDTHSYLKQTEDVLATLEARLQGGHTAQGMDSAESDVDTSSSVSQQSNQTKPHLISKKPFPFHRERSSASITSQDSAVQSSVSDRAEKQRSFKTDTFRKPAGLRRSVGKHGSTDLSNDHHSSSRQYSDQESHHTQVSRKYTVPLQKEESKSTKVSQVLNRANSLSAPRPTRASMLRRARLGESDNEGTETDKASRDEVKQPQEPKKLSRWDMLAMPRKRTSSFNTPSDNEASSGPQGTVRSTGSSNRSTDVRGNTGRRSSISGEKPLERPQKAPLNKTPITRMRASSAKYTSSTASSRRRQKGSDYTSTSDEEYDSNQNTPKPKRSQPSLASHSTHSQPRPLPVVALRPAARSKDSEDENNEGEAYHNWSTHSAEIARLSQDLAKDLAILAREIHDVAGDGDSQNPGAESRASSTVTAHPQLTGHIPENRLNTQRGPSAYSAGPTEPIPKLNHQQSIRQRDENKEEVQMDNQLDPVSHIINTIKENTEELSEKIKVLFQDKMDIWEEIETKISADDDMPVLKTSNKDIASILLELRRVQRQLEVMNTVVKPSDHLEVTRASSAASSSSGVRPSRVVSSQEWRTTPSVSRRGGGPRPGARFRSVAIASDDCREGYLV